ncbi:PDZ and LIM domain protein Zasp [Blattella germanica]|nr:PDZ and LIM domain protein Zasp [Blattella germanica]
MRGPFITALGKNWCPEHFVCVNAQCRRPLADIGFVEEKGELYCEYCFEKYLAPTCNKCNNKIKGDCLNAIGKHFHPECFLCAYCGKLFGNNPFFLEDGLPYCEADWNELFTTKCFACGFPIEAGDRWVEALNNNYHSQCFNCTNCKKNLEGQSFYAKGGRPFCKAHAR